MQLLRNLIISLLFCFQIFAQDNRDNLYTNLNNISTSNSSANITDNNKTEQDSDQKAKLDPSKILLDNIRNSFKKYRLNAGWLIDEFKCLNIDEFTQIWLELTDIFTKSENRWYYFCDKKEDFDDEQYWKYSLNQCIAYDKWLKETYVDLKTLNLVGSDFRLNKKANIIDYWDYIEQESQEKIYYNFYFFYIDCLTHVFNEAINKAKEFINEKEQFRQYFNLAYKLLTFMEKCLVVTQKSKQFSQYHLAVTALAQIMALLEQESIKG